MTKHNPKTHHRRSIRLKEYDYSQEGFYFITICTHNHVCLFGKISDNKMVLNNAGKIAKEFWLDIPEHYPNTRLHEYVVMPNHVHGIIQIVNDVGVGVQDFEPLQQPKQNKYQKTIPRSIGSMVRGFKIGVTKWFRKNVRVQDFEPIPSVWQRNYYEHIIRNEQSYYKISEYIIKNPSHWLTDKYYEQDF
ncbi:MAG: hypothetical protein D8M57_04350 [Candidatus Scalindua sp. AMX11]|nr:MAG: hypothetical protein DWQ00_04245 [Candidatus Scalindua sp.]NOG84651.1 hypothetical protein [Planctomycetota bacterium]RZV92423.1 MAG: hypothetical protein EX341_05085 [Candidatus Scalindua sp. SCAELEC01]TDE66049.1 MAG: hypothetical protein D8M57_04350 [Candidatus Scalindua sp. AMX11]GJQ59022.1 MAG: hypothetical protein SCALA701_18230 [Candidatus Scalindua sp.]